MRNTSLMSFQTSTDFVSIDHLYITMPTSRICQGLLLSKVNSNINDKSINSRRARRIINSKVIVGCSCTSFWRTYAKEKESKLTLKYQAKQPIAVRNWKECISKQPQIHLGWHHNLQLHTKKKNKSETIVGIIQTATNYRIRINYQLLSKKKKKRINYQCISL